MLPAWVSGKVDSGREEHLPLETSSPMIQRLGAPRPALRFNELELFRRLAKLPRRLEPVLHDAGVGASTSETVPTLDPKKVCLPRSLPDELSKILVRPFGFHHWTES